MAEALSKESTCSNRQRWNSAQEIPSVSQNYEGSNGPHNQRNQGNALQTVRKGAQEFEEITTKFRDAHKAYHAILDDDFEIQALEEYFECENQWIVTFHRTLEEWFSRAESEINLHDSVNNTGSKSCTRKSHSKLSHKSLRSLEAGSLAASPWTNAVAKRASLTTELAALRQRQNLQEEELRLKQQQEARLRLEQHKQLQLQTEIAKLEAEEHISAVAEQGDHYFRQQFPVWTLDLSPILPPTQPRPSALCAPDQFWESTQATSGLIKVLQEPRRSEEL